MDTVTKLRRLAGKYRYVLMVVLAGLALMLLPEQGREEPSVSTPPQPHEESTQEALEEILSTIQGVGKVRVLLTQQQGGRTVYVVDESTVSDTRKTETVLVTDASRSQAGLVSQVIPPVYLGAVVVCQGGDSPQVRLSIVEAVCNATGLSADKISVLKMK